MKIAAVNLYTVDSSGNDYGGPASPRPYDGSEQTAPAGGLPGVSPMSMFDDLRSASGASPAWKGHNPFGWAYAPFVVELESDAGVTGFAVNTGGGELACEVIDAFFRPLIEGKSPFDSALIWEQMYRAQMSWDQGGVAYMAISAVDLAVWDLKAKILGKPVYDLIGGRVRDAIPCYVTTFADVMESFVDQGFAGVKLAVRHGPADADGVNDVVALVRDARELFGPDLPLMLDCYMGWDDPFTIDVAAQLRPYGVEWIEDPILADATARRFRDIRERIRPIKLALGNQVWGEQRFQSLIEGDAVDVVQPELQWAGGLTSALRLAAVCRARGLKMIPHTSGAYSYHFTQAHIDCPVAEYINIMGDRRGVAARQGAIVGEPAPNDGHVILSDAPGFGIELNREVVTPYARSTHALVDVDA